MRPFGVLALAYFMIATPVACAELKIQGEWQLVSAELTVGEQTFPTFNPDTHQMIKIITDSHFSYLSKGPVRPQFSSYSPSGKEKQIAFENFGGGAGRYSLDGDIYTEHVEYSMYPNYEGHSLVFKVTIEGEFLVQEGPYPIKKLGLGDNDGYVKEVYRRLR